MRRTAVVCLVAGLLALFLPSASAASGGVPGVLAQISYSNAKAPAEGFTEITFPLTVLDSSNPKAAWLWADEVAFVGDKSTADFGLQPINKTAVFNVQGADTSVVKGNASRCKASKAGTSCSVAVNWVTGRAYRFTIYLASRGSRESWIGTLTDTVTKQSTTLGSWTVNNSRGLVRPASGFAEYYGSVASCASLPQAAARYDAPTAQAASTTFSYGVAQVVSTGQAGSGKLDCRTSAHNSKTASSATVRAPLNKAPVPAATHPTTVVTVAPSTGAVVVPPPTTTSTKPTAKASKTAATPTTASTTEALTSPTADQASAVPLQAAQDLPSSGVPSGFAIGLPVLGGLLALAAIAYVLVKNARTA